jgi:hypothetical protein
LFRSAIAILCFLTLLPFIMTQPSAPPGAGSRRPARPSPLLTRSSAIAIQRRNCKRKKSSSQVPDPKLARQHLQILTAAPHVAGSPEDRRTAEYVLQQYTAAGLDASIQPYKVWMALPLDIRVDVVAPREW